MKKWPSIVELHDIARREGITFRDALLKYGPPQGTFPKAEAAISRPCSFNETRGCSEEYPCGKCDAPPLQRLEAAMMAFYRKEQNIEIASFWDADWTVRLGDRANGYTWESPICSIIEIAEWLEEKYAELYGGYPLSNDFKAAASVNVEPEKCCDKQFVFNGKEGTSHYCCPEHCCAERATPETWSIVAATAIMKRRT